MAGTDRVVAAADAAATAQEMLSRARAANALLARIAALAGTLSNPQVWDSAGAERFRARNAAILGGVRAAGLTLETTAATALASIQGIDNADAVNTMAVADTFQLYNAAMISAFPPVHGWSGPGTPVVNDTGAFQPDHGNDYQKDIAIVSTSPDLIADQQLYAESVAQASRLSPGSDASHFFQHYLDGTGTDFHYDSTIPYAASPHFASLVNQAAQAGIQQAQASGQNSFDSGYIYDSAPFKGNANWTGAVGGSFHRLVGHRNVDGTWTTAVQITSYYQFVPGVNFGPAGLANGGILHEMEREGIAQDYHSIGSGTLVYDSQGKLLSGAGA